MEGRGRGVEGIGWRGGGKEKGVEGGGGPERQWCGGLGSSSWRSIASRTAGVSRSSPADTVSTADTRGQTTPHFFISHHKLLTKSVY